MKCWDLLRAMSHLRGTPLVPVGLVIKFLAGQPRAFFSFKDGGELAIAEYGTPALSQMLLRPKAGLPLFACTTSVHELNPLLKPLAWPDVAPWEEFLTVYYREDGIVIGETLLSEGVMLERMSEQTSETSGTAQGDSNDG